MASSPRGLLARSCGECSHGLAVPQWHGGVLRSALAADGRVRLADCDVGMPCRLSPLPPVVGWLVVGPGWARSRATVTVPLGTASGGRAVGSAFCLREEAPACGGNRVSPTAGARCGAWGARVAPVSHATVLREAALQALREARGMYICASSHATVLRETALQALREARGYFL